MANNRAVEPGFDFYQHNLDQAIEVISETDPDIIGFQEIDYGAKRSFYQNQFDSIGLQCGYSFGGKAVNWDKNYVPFPYWPLSVQYGRILSGQGILSKFPILENQRIVLEKPEDNPAYYNAFYIDRLIQVSKLRIGEHNLIVMNVHLEAFDEETREIQGERVIEVYRKYCDQYPVLLIGDFNAEPEFYSDRFNHKDIMVQFNSEPGLQPAISADEYYGERSDHYTFSSERPGKKIDYIFYNDSIQEVRSGVLRAAGTISDHLPLYMEFTFSDGSKN
jgi:endonuclease/exonuclease/phosphatase family metal-dependent hydrolase